MRCLKVYICNWAINKPWRHNIQYGEKRQNCTINIKSAEIRSYSFPT